jgi:hypothetical protein
MTVAVRIPPAHRPSALTSSLLVTSRATSIALRTAAAYMSKSQSAWRLSGFRQLINKHVMPRLTAYSMKLLPGARSMK